MGCKDCDHRHPHCHKDCPDYAAMKRKCAALAEAKEKARIGTSSIGRTKGIEEFRKYQHRLKR